MESWAECTGFDWDDGNIDKNWEKHRVRDLECEEVFFNAPIVVRHDPAHSDEERRFHALGRTDEGRQLFVAFAVRQGLIGAISAREMTVRERRLYESYEKREET